MENETIQLGLFDERGIVEVVDSADTMAKDPENPKIRYCLCKNLLSAERETKTRERLLEKTKEGLDTIAQSPRKSTADRIGVRVGRIMSTRT